MGYTEYKEMELLACMVADSNIDTWDKRDVEGMLDWGISGHVLVDFFEAYQNRFGISLKKQIRFVAIVEDE